MVQTKEQYVLVHQAVRELFKEQLCMIDSHPYENVDTNGLLMIKEEENTYDTIDYSPKGCSEGLCINHCLSSVSCLFYYHNSVPYLKTFSL